jgi:hypothetical protein
LHVVSLDPSVFIVGNNNNRFARLLLRYYVSGLVLLLASILHSPQESMAQSDMQLIEPLLRLLDSLQGYTSGTDLRRMCAICTNLERRALAAIDTHNSDHRLVRKQKRTFDAADDSETVRDVLVSNWVNLLEKAPEDTLNHEVLFNEAHFTEAQERLTRQQHIAGTAFANVPATQDACGFRNLDELSIVNTTHDQTQADWAWLSMVSQDQGHNDYLNWSRELA